MGAAPASAHALCSAALLRQRRPHHAAPDSWHPLSALPPIPIAPSQDAPVGVEAAVAAGMPVVAVPDPRIGAGKCGGAAQVLASLEEFDPVAWGLPPYGGACSGGGGAASGAAAAADVCG